MAQPHLVDFTPKYDTLCCDLTFFWRLTPSFRVLTFFFRPPPLCSFLLLCVASAVRRDARNDRRRANTSAGDGAEGSDEENLSVLRDSRPVGTDSAGCVSGNHQPRTLVLMYDSRLEQRALLCLCWDGTLRPTRMFVVVHGQSRS